MPKLSGKTRNVSRFKGMETYELALLGASKGGLARAKTLSPRRRKQIARIAALARWGRRKVKKVA